MSQWEGISEFVSAAELESFTSAANQLSTSVAQVSRRIARLEAHLGVKLFVRTTRRVALTEAGQVYYHHCKQLVSGLEAANSALTEMQSAVKGKIRLTAPVYFGENELAPLLTDFAEQHSDLQLDIVLTNRQLDIIEGGFDLAIRLGNLSDSNLIAKKLGTRQMHVCASPQYLAQHGQPHSLAELSYHQCLVGSQPYWRFSEKGAHRQIRVDGRFRCNSGHFLAMAAKRGIGIAQLPDVYVHQDLERGDLVELLLPFREKEEGIWALYPQKSFLPYKTKMLLDHLVEGLKGR